MKLAFTGHRPNVFGGYEENRPMIVDVKEALYTIIHYGIQHGYTEFISGMALGVDIWAAEEVLAQKLTNPTAGVKLIAMVPWEGQATMWPAKSIERYLKILNAADEVYIRGQLVTSLPKLPVKTTDNSNYRQLLLQRNLDMIAMADAVAGIWNGDDGGTGHCMKHAYHTATQRKLKVIRYNPRTQEWYK